MPMKFVKGMSISTQLYDRICSELTEFEQECRAVEEDSWTHTFYELLVEVQNHWDDIRERR